MPMGAKTDAVNGRLGDLAMEPAGVASDVGVVMGARIARGVTFSGCDVGVVVCGGMGCKGVKGYGT